MRALARSVRAAACDAAFPLVLAGNCVSCLGTTAGIGPRGLGVVWLDAHADFDTPEDNVSGSFDVMGLAMLTGSGWRALRETIPGFAPVAEADVVLAGVRDLEPYQRTRLAASAVRSVPGDVDPVVLAAALEGLRERAGRVYLHIDLDALDPRDGRANAYAADGGPSLERLLAALELVFDRVEVAAAALTSFDVACDVDGRVLEAARALLALVARRARAQRGSPGAMMR